MVMLTLAQALEPDRAAKAPTAEVDGRRGALYRHCCRWTGDGVPLQGSVESMVDCGVHDMKLYVHSVRPPRALYACLLVVHRVSAPS